MPAKNKESYRDNPLLKRVGVQVNFTEEQVDEYIKCSRDPIYFAKYIKIITLDEGVTDFKINEIKTLVASKIRVEKNFKCFFN